MATKSTQSDPQVAVIESSGMQAIVSVGDSVKVPLLDLEPGAPVPLTDLLTGKKVSASVVGHGRHPKVTGRLFRNKVRARRYPRGHRQDFTTLTVSAIQ